MMKNSISIMVIGILIVSSISSINATGISSVIIPTNRNSGIEPINSIYNSFNSNKLDSVPGEIIVKFKENVKISVASNQDYVVTGLGTIDNINEMFKVNSVEKIDQTGTSSFISNVYKLKFPQDTSISSVVDEYGKNPNVEYAEPNYIYHMDAIPNDPYFSKQWALNQSNGVDINAPKAWDLNTGSGNVVIAVIDSGIDYTHPDLKDRVWMNKNEISGNNIDDDGNGYVDDVMGWNFISNTNDPLDELGHGTHCAGIIGAEGNNGIGISGVCWNCSIMPLKIFSKFGDTDLGLIARALAYAADNGANVISMSWGSTGFSQLLKDSIDYAYSKGVVLVAAAGNSGGAYKEYPAALDNVISVAALNRDNSRAFFSTYGSWVDVAAPGEDIYSTTPTYHVTLNDAPYNLAMNYGYASGTSMACPMVAGLAGLILSKNPGMTQEEIKTLIRSAVSKVDSCTYIGTGNINAFKCLQNDSSPVANLDSSLDDQEVKNTVEIKGTAGGSTFKAYNIYIGHGNYPETWDLLDTSNSPVENNVLYSFDTTAYKDGRYSIRLEVVDLSGKKFQDRTIVLTNNVKATVYVNGDGTADFTTIGDAVNNSGNGDNIFVYNGTYRENLIIEKSISLYGENKNTTVIVGEIIYRNVNNIKISGFTFELTESGIINSNLNSQSYSLDYLIVEFEYYSFGAARCNNLTIKNNIFKNYTAPLLTADEIWPGAINTFVGEGIRLAGCTASLISDNVMIGHVFDPTVVKEGNSPTIGMALYGCSSVFVLNNTIVNNNALQKKGVEDASVITGTNESIPAGILLDVGTSNIVRNNIIENNFKGLVVEGDMYLDVSNNIIRTNTHGIYFEFIGGIGVNIHHNKITENKNGISLSVGCFYNNINNNFIEDNTIGIKGLDFALKILKLFVTDSQFNSIYNNSIKNNDIGIYGNNWANNSIHDNNIEKNKKFGMELVKSKNNVIYRNNFLNDGKFFFGKHNAKSSSGNQWFNGKEGNYWDDYKGLRFKRIVDHDKDGFGNIPYRIPRLQFDRHPKLEPYNILI